MRKKILITDDDPGIRDVFRIILEKAGYEVQLYTSGLAIMEDRFEHPDIFLLDRQLPGIDGLQICRYLKSKETTRSIPVIIVSASAHLSSVIKDTGADDYLEKPFNIQELLAKISKHLPLEKGQQAVNQ